MIANVVPVVASPEVVPDEVLDPATGTVDGLEKVEDLDDEFLALIYSDEQLLRAEFDALMATAFTSPPPAGGRDRGAEHPPGSPRTKLLGMRGRLPLAVGARGRRCAARTRAPPGVPDGSRSSCREGGEVLDFCT